MLQALADSQRIPYLEASAKSNYHISEIFMTLCARIQEKEAAIARMRPLSASTLMRIAESSPYVLARPIVFA